MLKFLIQTIMIILTIFLLIFNVYGNLSVNYFNVLVITIVMTLLSTLCLKYKKVNRRQIGMNIFTIFGFTFLFQSMLFLIGSRTGYISNTGCIFKGYIDFKLFIFIFAISFVKEILRYIIVEARCKNKVQYYILQALAILMFVALDMCLATKKYAFMSFSMMYEFFALFLLPSISKNIFLAYLSKKSGYLLTFTYIFVMDLNIYFVPTSTKLNMLFQSTLFLIFPYIIYLYFASFDSKDTINEKRIKKESKLISFMTTALFIIIVCLVSREFSYAMIGIGSGSMTGTINKGDAIIYKKYESSEDTLDDQVIVFIKENKMIVHRVIKSYILDGKQVYQTKGDANYSPDNWIVKEDDIIGVVKYRVPFIAWPSVMIGELF